MKKRMKSGTTGALDAATEPLGVADAIADAAHTGGPALPDPAESAAAAGWFAGAVAAEATLDVPPTTDATGISESDLAGFDAAGRLAAIPDRASPAAEPIDGPAPTLEFGREGAPAVARERGVFAPGPA